MRRRAIKVALISPTGARIFRCRSCGAFEPQLFVLHWHVLVAADLVPAALLPRFDDIARHRVDELLLEPIPGALVDLPEGHALARRRRVHRDWTGDERESDSLSRRAGGPMTRRCSDG